MGGDGDTGFDPAPRRVPPGASAPVFIAGLAGPAGTG
jgi:hypothetical protein